MEIKGSTTLLTGATGGIGSAIARRLAAEGSTLILTDLDQASLDTLAASLPGAGHVAIAADLSSRKTGRTLVAKAEEAGGPIDILINNAGMERTAVFHELDPDTLDQILKVNLRAPMLLTQAAIPGMLERGRGHVVLMASTAGLAGPACLEPYSAGKAALVRFAESLRGTYRDSPLGFSAICPGFTKGGGMFTRMRAKGNKPNPLLGSTTVDEVAATVSRAITDDLPLVVSNNRPVRPLTLLTTATPRLAGRAIELSGANRFFRADATNRSD